MSRARSRADLRDFLAACTTGAAADAASGDGSLISLSVAISAAGLTAAHKHAGAQVTASCR